MPHFPSFASFASHMVSGSAINFQFRKYGDYGPGKPALIPVMIPLVLAQDFDL